jgi:hypothetical protein
MMSKKQDHAASNDEVGYRLIGGKWRLVVVTKPKGKSTGG